MKKQLTAIELQNLINKSKAVDTGLSLTEHRLLCALISYINKDYSQGYKSFPSSDQLMDRTGLKLRTIAECRKTLQAKGWVKIISGRGKGNSNNYFLNASKVVDCYNMSNKPLEVSADECGNLTYEKIVPVKSEQVRNTTYLKQNKPTKAVQEPADEPYDDPFANLYDDDPNAPF